MIYHDQIDQAPHKNFEGNQNNYYFSGTNPHDKCGRTTQI